MPLLMPNVYENGANYITNCTNVYLTNRYYNHVKWPKITGKRRAQLLLRPVLTSLCLCSTCRKESLVENTGRPVMHKYMPKIYVSILLM